MKINIDNEGFVLMQELLAHPRFSSLGYTKEHILGCKTSLHKAKTALSSEAIP